MQFLLSASIVTDTQSNNKKSNEIQPWSKVENQKKSSTQKSQGKYKHKMHSTHRKQANERLRGTHVLIGSGSQVKTSFLSTSSAQRIPYCFLSAKGTKLMLSPSTSRPQQSPGSEMQKYQKILLARLRTVPITFLYGQVR